MSYFVESRNVNSEDVFTQKCLIPCILLEESKIKPSDVVTLNFGLRSYICRAFPFSPTEMEMCVAFDDTVSYHSGTNSIFPNRFIHEHLLFPDSLRVVKVKLLEKIRVKITLTVNQNLCLKKKEFHEVVCKLLQNYFVKRNAVVKCKGQKLADLFNIKEITIAETFQEENVIGSLNTTSIIEIVEVISDGQLLRSKEFDDKKIYGQEDATKHLKFFILQRKCRKVVVLGPSGSGKSLFIKKFCCDMRYHLTIIDCLTTPNLSLEKCDTLCKQLFRSSKMFPDRLSVLLVDHLDKLTTSNRDQHSSFVASLLYLFKSLNQSNILIIIVATQRKFIHPKLNYLFNAEVFLGVLSFQQQRDILKALTELTETEDIDFDKISGMMSGFLANDIVRLIEAAKQLRKKSFQENPTKPQISLTTQDFEKALYYFTPSLLKTSEWNLKVKPIFWKDIGGMEDIKKRLHLSIEMPLLHPEIFEKVGLHCPKGLLLFGPPGCCKTTLARGLATNCNANFFAANPSQIYSSYVGESEKNISQLFYQARLCAPSIIFLDELDSLVGCRNLDTKQQGVAEKVLSTLLNEMDGLGVRTDFKDDSTTAIGEIVEGKNYLRNEVIVIAATNRPDCIDDALLRPGRFDIILYVPPPTLEERESILKTITEGMPLKEVSLKTIASKTEFFSGADLKNLCNMAAMNALKEDLMNAEYVMENNFFQALKNLQPSITRDQIYLYEELSNKYGPVITKK